tara:strand:+ start:1835 stop:2347 length:513 start_codon:yes stop_codon:yes gene_type:complete
VTINYTDEFEFPADFGFTKSSTPKKMSRGGRNLRDEEARVIGVQDNASDEMRRVKRRKPKDAAERRDKRAQEARVGSRERNARDEMGRLRDEAKQGFRAAEGGSKKDWIKGAVKKPGALREYMDVKEGQPIPKGKINKVASGKPATAGGPKPSAKTMKRANLAKSFSKMN